MRPLAVLLFAPLVLGEEPEKPVLVHSDPACFVHALRATASVPSDRLERVVEPGLTLVHTVRATGAMTVLLPTTGVVAISTRRISYRLTRILGIAADKERLYVLVWTVGTYDRPPKLGAAVEGGHYELRAFWLADGARLAAPSLDDAKLPKDVRAETLENGPLRLIDGGVECHGSRVRYKGRELSTP